MLWELNNRTRSGIQKIKIDCCEMGNGDDGEKVSLFLKKNTRWFE